MRSLQSITHPHSWVWSISYWHFSVSKIQVHSFLPISHVLKSMHCYSSLPLDSFTIIPGYHSLVPMWERPGDEARLPSINYNIITVIIIMTLHINFVYTLLWTIHNNNNNNTYLYQMSIQKHLPKLQVFAENSVAYRNSVMHTMLASRVQVNGPF